MENCQEEFGKVFNQVVTKKNGLGLGLNAHKHLLLKIITMEN
jgi:hypothetical protein